MNFCLGGMLSKEGEGGASITIGNLGSFDENDN